MGINRLSVENRVKTMLQQCHGREKIDFEGNREKNLFSMSMGVSFQEFIYFFLILQDEMGIPLDSIEWTDEVFTYQGLCDLVWKYKSGLNEQKETDEAEYEKACNGNDIDQLNLRR